MVALPHKCSDMPGGPSSRPLDLAGLLTLKTLIHKTRVPLQPCPCISPNFLFLTGKLKGKESNWTVIPEAPSRTVF